MPVIAILDFLFVYAFVGLGLAVFLVGVRITLMSNVQFLIVSSSVLLVSGAIAAIIACAWMFIDVTRQGATIARMSEWKIAVRRYPVLVGPAAYYLGELRSRRGGQPTWFSRLMKSRSVLDVVNFVAWHGMLAGFYLVSAAVVAAILQSPFLFTLVGVLFAALVPISGWAFSLLSIVVFVHAIERTRSAQPPWTVFPLVGYSLVHGVHAYYLEAIRPTLTECRDSKSHI